MKYRIIREDIIKNLVDFLDEIQFDAASGKEKDDLHKVNFCGWAIQELLNSYNVVATKDFRKSKDDPKKPKKKKRDDYIEETFMDWNLPEMSDEDFEKLVDNFDNFLRAWEKEYNKKNPKKKSKKRKSKKFNHTDVIQHMSLEEIREYLLDDPELTDKERFDLYYDEYERIQKDKELKKAQSLDDMCKKLKIKLPPKDEQN